MLCYLAALITEVWAIKAVDLQANVKVLLHRKKPYFEDNRKQKMHNTLPFSVFRFPFYIFCCRF